MASPFGFRERSFKGRQMREEMHCIVFRRKMSFGWLRDFSGFLSDFICYCFLYTIFATCKTLCLLCLCIQ